MLPDPQTVTVNSVAKVLPRINQDNNSSVYRLRSSLDEYLLTLKHSNGKIVGGQPGEGHLAKVDYTVFATATTPEQHLAVWAVIQNPKGFDLVLARNITLGLTGYLISATIDKLLNGES
jgi:hypothetical protein